MKKLVCTFALLVSLLFFNACSPESEYHYTAIYYPDLKSTLFADQTEDSISFVTFDSWLLKSNAEWMRVPENMTSGEVPAGYYVRTSVPLYFDPNTTGESRSTILNIQTSENTLSVIYEQLPYLCITYPVRKNSAYELTDSSFVATDSLVFHAYGIWNVAFVNEQPEWIAWQASTPVSGRAGRQKVQFDIQENQTENERRAVVRITSNGVSNDVTIVQLPPKEED